MEVVKDIRRIGMSHKITIIHAGIEQKRMITVKFTPDAKIHFGLFQRGTRISDSHIGANSATPQYLQFADRYGAYIFIQGFTRNVRNARISITEDQI